MHALAPDQVHLDRLRQTEFAPVFIMGDHRSGTTLFYQLLARTHQFNVLTAYQVIRYDELVTRQIDGTETEAREELRREFASLGLSDRGLDHVRVSPELPEEYGFLLGGARPRISPRTLQRFTEICRKIQFLGSPDRPLLLKNPWDYLNFLTVRDAFPSARFLFIHRDPVHIVTSQLRALRDGFQRHNPYVARLAPWYDELWRQPVRLRLLRALYSDRHRMGLRITCRHVTRATRYFMDHVEKLAPHTHISLRYEDLCRDPNATLQKVLAFLEVDESGTADASSQIQPRPDRMLPAVEAPREWIYSKTRLYCERFGYGDPEPGAR